MADRKTMLILSAISGLLGGYAKGRGERRTAELEAQKQKDAKVSPAQRDYQYYQTLTPEQRKSFEKFAIKQNPTLTVVPLGQPETDVVEDI